MIVHEVGSLLFNQIKLKQGQTFHKTSLKKERIKIVKGEVEAVLITLQGPRGVGVVFLPFTLKNLQTTHTFLTQLLYVFQLFVWDTPMIFLGYPVKKKFILNKNLTNPI